MGKKLKILHISSHSLHGGAARSAFRRHLAAIRAGHDSTIFSLTGGGHLQVQTYKPPSDFASRLRRRWRRSQIGLAFARYRFSRPPGYELFSDDRSEFDADLLGQMVPADIVNLHWVAGFVDYPSFLVPVSRRTPMVWSLHDMNPFTGGCHYDTGCGRFVYGCGSCPQLGSRRDSDLSREIWNRKRATYEAIAPGRLHVVVQNHWMAAQVRSSVLMSKFRLTIIPSGVDTEDFSPRNRRFARTLLGLPQDARVVLFVADSVDIRRKGFAALKQALDGLVDLPKLFLASVGSGEPALDGPVPHLHLGRTDNDRLLSLIYSAADLFVIPSLHDNMPNTVIEALACGTPVVGFAAGGIADMVQHGVTGLLVPVGEVEALRRDIRELLEDFARRQEMAVNCRRIAIKEYSLEVMGRNYSNLYKRILSEGH
jgi:glycosyltransferase involved in cell wall biosynthesis